MFLLDGYNLLHAMGLLDRRAGPRALLRARKRLLGLLLEAFADDAARLTVVFDAENALPGSAGQEEFKGIRIVWSVGQGAADDVIEAMIEQAPIPKQLTVVSDDRRIQRAASRRDCPVLGCLDFMEQIRNKPPASQSPPAAKSRPEEKGSHKDREFWLREFADLQDSPEMKRLSDPPDWQEIDEKCD